MKKRRHTKQRDLILETLRSVNTHPTATEIYDMVRPIMPNISLGTVYRNLEQLTEAHKIQKLDHTGSQSRFDGTPDFHAHILCSSCGRVDDVTTDKYLQPQVKIDDFQGYAIRGMRVEFVGTCQSCSEG